MLPLPTTAPSRLTWLHVGSSDSAANRRFLAEHLDAGPELLDWLAEASGAPAYWSPDAGGVGVRLPLALGARSWAVTEGIPERLEELVPFLKVAVVGDAHVVTSLALSEEIDYALPADLLLTWPPDLDRWARDGAVGFAHRMLREQLTDTAWHSASIQTVLDDEWRADGALWRLRTSVVIEAHLAELQIQHETVTEANDWFGEDDPRDAALTTRALNLAMQRLAKARDVERDEIQLSLLSELRMLGESERRSGMERERQADATERLTRRLTLVSVAFLPATLVCGLLGANWGTAPLPDGWTGLGVVAACAGLLTAVFALGARRLTRDEATE